MRYSPIGKFDPNAKFVAARVMTFDGLKLEPGDAIDVSNMGRTRIRQLFEARRIKFAPAPAEQKPVVSQTPNVVQRRTERGK
jgi:hypothetical protein